MDQRVVFILIIFAVLIVIGGGITGWSIFGSDHSKDPLPYKIAKLPLLKLDTVESYENYRDLTERTNDLITILNEQSGVEIPKFETTQEAWHAVSKKINKYGPLINNYQNLTQTARILVNNDSDQNYKEFYLSLGKFSLETGLISLTLFHAAAFESVGLVYRSTGLSSIALKCPSCVSVVLSGAYWTVKTALVEESSKIAEKAINALKEFKPSEGFY